jgi:peptidyl-prolyl cis-trans isomerase SurA
MKFLCAFLSLFITFNADARIIDRTAAVVNSAVILASDVSDFNKQTKFRSQLDPFIAAYQLGPESERDILNYLIQEQLILQKFQPKDEQVEDAINNVQRSNGINREQLKQVLANEGIAFDLYQELMRTSVAKGQLIRQLQPLAAVSDEQVKNFYYTSPEFKDFRKNQKAVISYDLEQLMLPNKTTADLAISRLNGGDDLDSVLNLVRDRGAELVNLGQFSEETLNPTTRKALESVGSGGYSQPISTGSGYIILHVKSVGSPKDPAFERVKDQVRSKLFRVAFRKQLTAWTAHERGGSFVHIP